MQQRVFALFLDAGAPLITTTAEDSAKAPATALTTFKAPTP